MDVMVERTPEYYALIDKESKQSADELAKMLTIDEMREYCQQLLAMNALLRQQLMEEVALFKPLCIFSKDEADKRRAQSV